MNILDINRGRFPRLDLSSGSILRFCLVLLLWPLLPNTGHFFDASTGTVIPTVWLLVVLALISFCFLVLLCGWMVNKLVLLLNLPSVGSMVSQFRTLELCHQFGFYWASFALLLFAGAMCLLAIC